MFKTLRNALKIADIRRKLLFTFLVIVVVRIGSQIPTPGINTSFVAQWWQNQTSSAFNFFNTITGSSFTNMSIFALSITPYITASIIVQLLTIAIPKLEEMQKEGEEGRKFINKITRYLNIGLSVIQSLSIAIGLGSSMFIHYTWYNVIMMVVIMTTGSAVLMWLGEQITEKGIGNGISIILLVNIISDMPTDFRTLYTTFIKGKAIALGIVTGVVILALLVGLVVFVIYLQDGERRIPVQYAKKMQGRKLVGGQSSHIPLKVNTAGVIPVIFVSSLMSFPGMIASFIGYNFQAPSTIPGHIIKLLTQSQWCDPNAPIYTIGLAIYLALLVFFAYFYTSITFNPLEVANNMKKQGGFIPGIRPGRPTSEYLEGVLNYLILIGAAGLAVVAVVPIVLTGLFGVGSSLCFFGTSIIIIVGVILETLKQVESMMLVRFYKGFLSD